MVHLESESQVCCFFRRVCSVPLRVLSLSAHRQNLQHAELAFRGLLQTGASSTTTNGLAWPVSCYVVAGMKTWLWGAVMCLSVFASGCLFVPGHEREVCGADKDVVFSGYLPSSGSVTVQVATSESGPFVDIGTIATGNSVNWGGETFYRFSDALPVDEWLSSTTGLSFYARVQTGGGFNLLTFEHQNGAGQSGLGCVLFENVNNGLTLTEAALTCDRNEPVVRVDAPLLSTCSCTPFAEPGDLIISDARDAALARCVTSVGGDLRVMDSAPDLVSLDQLVSVGGEAELHYELPVVGGSSSHRNRSIDLSALTTIGGDVRITTHRGFNEPKTIDTMTGAVTSVGGDITISTYDNNVTAFGSLTTVAGSVTLEGETGAAGNLDVFGSGTLPSLTTIGTNLKVQGFFACNNVFNSVTSVGGDVLIRAVRLSPVPSLQSLTSVGGELRFHEMKQFGPDWPALTSVGGELYFLDNSVLSALTDAPLGSVSVDSLRIEGQVNLTTLDGSLQVGAGDIHISGNTALSQCEVDTFLTTQGAGGWSGTSFVSDTLVCP